MQDFNRKWITENAVDVIKEYEEGVLTLRALHYQLVGRGMTNDTPHYKKVVSAMIKARWDGVVSFETFSDHDREIIGSTSIEPTILEDEIETAKRQINLWMNNYFGSRWENQPFVPEVWIEKKALQGVFDKVCEKKRSRSESLQRLSVINFFKRGERQISGLHTQREISGDSLFRRLRRERRRYSAKHSSKSVGFDGR